MLSADRKPVYSKCLHDCMIDLWLVNSYSDNVPVDVLVIYLKPRLRIMAGMIYSRLGHYSSCLSSPRIICQDKSFDGADVNRCTAMTENIHERAN